MEKHARNEPHGRRDALRFPEAVRAHFGFLSSRGFNVTSTLSTYVRLEHGGLFIAVFHGRSSFEVGVEIGRMIEIDGELVGQKFHIQDFLRLLCPNEVYRSMTALTGEQVDRFVAQLAKWTAAVIDATQDSPSDTFDRLSDQAQRYSRQYLDGLRARRLRASVDDAWARKDLLSVIAAYEEIEAELETVQLKASERKRLEYARKHAT